MSVRRSIVLLRTAYHDLAMARTPWAVLLLLGFVLSAPALFYAVEAWLDVLTYWMGTSGETSGATLRELTRTATARLGVAAALLLVLGLLTWRRYRRQRVVPKASFRPPEPRRGLVWMLSRYGLAYPTLADVAEACAGYGHACSAQELGAALEVPASLPALDALLARAEGDPGAVPDLRRRLFATNLGPLVAAVERHRPRLRHVWLVSTPETAGLIGRASRLVRVLAPGVRCHPTQSAGREAAALTVDPNHDLREAMAVIERVFAEEAPAAGLEPDDVIADFTGGSAAMTAGMVLVTLDERRRVEYFRQGLHLLEAVPPAAGAAFDPVRDVAPLTADEVVRREVLVEVETSYRLARLPDPGPA